MPKWKKKKVAHLLGKFHELYDETQLVRDVIASCCRDIVGHMYISIAILP